MIPLFNNQQKNMHKHYFRNS